MTYVPFLPLDVLDRLSLAYSVDELLPEEKQYYAESLVIEGEKHLLRGHFTKGLELFTTASKLAPASAKLLYTQGLSLFEYGSEEGQEKALLLANRKFKMATKAAPEYFEAWHCWGVTLLLLGKTTGEHHYFQEAKEKLRKATLLSDKQSPDILADLYWDSAVVFQHLATFSGEALDLHIALEAFQKASTFQEHLPEPFWNDYGDASLQLAKQISDMRLYVKAIHCFKHSITLSSSFYEGWHSLATALQKLYEHTHDEDHFAQANECFSTASALRPNDYALWLKWATFLCDSGRSNQDSKRLRACIEKCHRAYACDPEQPMISAVWAEALALLGDLTERLDLIYDAQNKIAQAVDLAPDLPDVYYSYGMCLRAFGHYFHDLDYYYQAIEKFQEGLSIDRTCHRHWHAIASTYTLLGQIEEEPKSLELSLRFYSKALDLHTSSFYVLDYAFALAKFGEIQEDKQWLEEAICQFERALNLQRNAVYLHPDWLFHYACTLDLLGDYHEEESYYLRAVDIFSHVLMIDPDFPHLHHRLALAFSHLGEFSGEREHFYRALHHFRLSTKHEEENDQVTLDWALALINISQHTHDSAEAEQCFKDAEQKLISSAKLGNLQSFYQLSCLYSLLGQYEKALHFLEKGSAFDALPPFEEIHQDEWLDGLRHNVPNFSSFLASLESRPHLQGER